MQFPIPERLPLGPLMDFGYEDEVAFPGDDCGTDGMKPRAGASGREGDLAGLRAGLRAGQGAPGARSEGASRGARPMAQEPKVGALGEAMTSDPEAAAAGCKRFSERRCASSWC